MHASRIIRTQVLTNSQTHVSTSRKEIVGGVRASRHLWRLCTGVSKCMFTSATTSIHAVVFESIHVSHGAYVVYVHY